MAGLDVERFVLLFISILIRFFHRLDDRLVVDVPTVNRLTPVSPRHDGQSYSHPPHGNTLDRPSHPVRVPLIWHAYLDVTIPPSPSNILSPLFSILSSHPFPFP